MTLFFPRHSSPPTGSMPAISDVFSFVSEVQVEEYTFQPKLVKPPGSSQEFFLAGAGVRGLHIQGEFIKFTAIGVYLEKTAIDWLAVKWSGKTGEELMESEEFFKDIINGPFDKLTHGTFIRHLEGEEYSTKVAGNCVDIWKAAGTYTDDKAKAIEHFLQVFKPQSFPPGSCILYVQPHQRPLTLAFTKHGEVPEVGDAVIENEELGGIILESIIGKNGVSPAAMESLTARMAEFFKKNDKHVH